MKKIILILAFIPIITLADTQNWQSFDKTQALAKLTRLQYYVTQKAVLKERSIINTGIIIGKASMSTLSLESHFLVLLINTILAQVGQVLLNLLITHL